jgi:hypothetical protein
MSLSAANYLQNAGYFLLPRLSSENRNRFGIPSASAALAELLRFAAAPKVDGGGEVGDKCKRLFKEDPESNRLIEIMFGYHSKASAYNRPFRNEQWD